MLHYSPFDDLEPHADRAANELRVAVVRARSLAAASQPTVSIENSTLVFGSGLRLVSGREVTMERVLESLRRPVASRWNHGSYPNRLFGNVP